MKKFTFFLSAFTASFLFFSPAWGQNITQVGTATTATSGGGTITINKPSGIASGDIMIASITQSETGTGDNLSDAAATFGDWTLVTGSKIGTGQNPEFRATIMYRIATADDVAAAATSYQFTLDAQAEGVVGSIIAFRGVAVTGGVTGGPFDVVPGQINGLANDNSLNAASINLTTGKSAVIMFGFIGNDPGINTNWNIATTPGTLTELFDVVSTEDADIEIGAAWGIANSPGATGTGSASLASIAENGSILIALRPIPATAVLTTSGVLNVGVGIPVNLTAAVTNFAGTGNYNFTWNAAGASGLGINPVTQPGANNTKTIAYAAPGIYTVSASISRAGATAMSTNSLTIKVVSVPSVPNLWASSSNGSQIAAFTVNDGVNLSGDPANLFETTFPGTITGGTFTSAIGRNNKPSQASGYFYWLANTPTNSGIVEVFGSNSTGTNTTRIGTLDLNYEAGTNHLGFVRLGMGPDGTGWILAGDNSTFILAKFRPDGLLQNSLLPAADRLTIVDPDVTLNGATATSFINGDICVGGDGSLLTLANDGFGVTQIFVGVPNGTSTTLTKKFDVLKQDSSPFNGNVNGVAFDALGSLYVSAFTGLFYIDKNTINGPAGTIAISQVWVGTGLTDLASNFFPYSIIIPVKLGSFEVNKSGSNAVLNWITHMESNSSHFEVERSTDGVNFISAGTVKAAGSSNDIRTYRFVDPVAGFSSIIYYRLRTVDMDATSSISKIVVLKLEKNKQDIKVRIYPNPFTNDLKLQIFSGKETAATVRISNALGQPVVDRKINLQSGENTIALSAELSSLDKGIYSIQIITQDHRFTEKIIKQ